MLNSLNGFLLVDKPVGWTSFDVCAKLRKPLGIKRIGHTGTLDPFATGLLVVAVGKCTKLIPFFEKDKKTYRTKILLGKTSETLDPESDIVDCHPEFSSESIPTKKEIETLLKEKFTGKIYQIPPKYSALKIDGQRAYKLAREGKEVEMKARETEVFDIKILNYEFPKIEIELSVAAGFYIRSFARDLGEILCGGGMCQELRRIGVGDLSIEKPEFPVIVNFESISGESLIDSQFLIKNIVHLDIANERIPDLQAGRAIMLEKEIKNGQKVLILNNGETVGVGEMINGNLQPRVVF